MQFENEIWKDIPNYEGLYQISNYGRIKSLYNYKRNGTNISEAGRKNNITISSISLCCNGKYKKAGGYIWKYKGVVSQ